MWSELLASVWMIGSITLLFYFLGQFKQKHSYLDLLWPALILLWALPFWWNHGGESSRAIVAGILLFTWAFRISLYLYLRGKEHGHSWRYDYFFKKWGAEGFWWKLFLMAYLRNFLISLVVAFPLILLFYTSRLNLGPDWGGSDSFFTLIWVLGFLIELVADRQLSIFRASPGKGELLDRGLWALCRHPNYLGECLMWWGFSGLAFIATQSWICWISAALMTLLLTRVSGIMILENQLREKEGGKDYISGTPRFWPKIKD